MVAVVVIVIVIVVVDEVIFVAIIIEIRKILIKNGIKKTEKVTVVHCDCCCCCGCCYRLLECWNGPLGQW
jgi:hypothetical protein